MKAILNYFSIFVSCLLLGLSSHSLAERDADKSWQAQAGMVASVNTSFYREVGEEKFVLPSVMAEYKGFYLQGIDFGYRFFQGLALANDLFNTALML